MSANLIGAGFGAIAGIGFSYAEQRSAIRAANRYNKQMRDNEVLGLVYQNRGRTTHQMQIEQVIQEDVLNTKLQALKAQGEARVSGAARGVTGQVQENIRREIQRQAERALSTLDANLKNSRASYMEDIQGNQFAAQSRIQAQTQKPKFSWLGLVSSGISGGMAGLQLQQGLSAKTNPEDGSSLKV